MKLFDDRTDHEIFMDVLKEYLNAKLSIEKKQVKSYPSSNTHHHFFKGKAQAIFEILKHFDLEID